MEIKVADPIGFCFGVKRAIRMAKEALENNKTKEVYSLGPIIHNNQVVDELSKEGLKPIKDLSGIEKGVCVISSHGVSPVIFERIKSKGLDVVNATCPNVMSAQTIVRSLSQEGYSVVILGDKDHPEVKSLSGFANDKAVVIKDEVQLKGLDLPSKKTGVVSQTTQSTANYFKIISGLLEKGFQEARIFNTICNDTQKRQRSAAKLAKEVDVMIIVGGRMSANTKRLFEICYKICKDTYHIETVGELRREWLEGKLRVGIASGASTPDWIIENIKNTCVPAGIKS